MADFEAGVFLVDKPEGPSSFTMVRMVRRLLGIKKVGHAGTLDPFASGLLVICVGRPATRLISGLMEGEKEYIATLKLGVETTTQDPEGDILRQSEVGSIDRGTIEGVLSSFTGELLQVPPVYSALKHKGKPLYYYARKGIEVKKAPRKVVINELQWLNCRESVDDKEPELTLRVICSKGTYIRTLAADIGRALGCGAFLLQLRRVRSGRFTVENSFPGGDFLADDARSRFLRGAIEVEKIGYLPQESILAQ